MRATRRNVLVILGVLTIAGGALFGTGAFTQVQAERGVSVDTTSDANALLTFQVNDNDYSGVANDSSDGVMALSFEDINKDANTTFSNVLTIENGGSQPVELTVDDETSALEFRADGTNLSAGNSVTLNSGDSVDVTVSVNLTGDTTAPSDGTTVTFDATATSN